MRRSRQDPLSWVKLRMPGPRHRGLFTELGVHQILIPTHETSPCRRHPSKVNALASTSTVYISWWIVHCCISLPIMWRPRGQRISGPLLSYPTFLLALYTLQHIGSVSSGPNRHVRYYYLLHDCKIWFSFTSALGARQTFAIDNNVLAMVLNMSGCYHCAFFVLEQLRLMGATHLREVVHAYLSIRMKYSPMGFHCGARYMKLKLSIPLLREQWLIILLITFSVYVSHHVNSRVKKQRHTLRRPTQTPTISNKEPYAEA